jgi:hypothetical protein
MMFKYEDLYAPSDVEEAHKNFGANCGPCALAAILGVLVRRVRRVFPEFDRKPWVTPSTMWTAIRLAGHTAIKRGSQWPTYGLAVIQWHGPWIEPGGPGRAAYRYTHWVAVAETVEYGRMVYDVNVRREWDQGPESDQRGAWVPLTWWDEEIAPRIMASIPRASGDWSLRWTCDLVRMPRQEEPSHA